MKIAVSILFFALVMPSSSRADAPIEGKWFQVSAVTHACYQTDEEAMLQGQRIMQGKAKNFCGSLPAIKWQDLKARLTGSCGIEQTAIYVCSSTPVCRPRMYWIQCCDQNGCWAE